MSHKFPFFHPSPKDLQRTLGHLHTGHGTLWPRSFDWKCSSSPCTFSFQWGRSFCTINKTGCPSPRKRRRTKSSTLTHQCSTYVPCPLFSFCIHTVGSKETAKDTKGTDGDPRESQGELLSKDSQEHRRRQVRVVVVDLCSLYGEKIEIMTMNETFKSSLQC